MKIFAVLALVCATCFGRAYIDAQKCKIIVEEATGQNYTYDLSELGELSASFHGNTFTLNLCQPVSSGCVADTAVCRNARLGNAGYTSIGKLSSREIVPYGFQPPQPGVGIVAMFGDGDKCSGDDTFSSSVVVVCDPNEKAMVAVTAEEDCYYEFSVSTKFGCGTATTSSDMNDSDNSESDSGEVVALVILLIMIIGLALYFVVGAVYQKKTADPGTLREYIIHNEFWCSLPSLVADGCKFIIHGCKRGDYVSA